MRGGPRHERGSDADPIVVSQRGDTRFSSVRSAALAAPAGSVILVRNGVYHEQLLIDRPLTVKGEGDADLTTLRTHGTTAALVKASANLSNLTLSAGADPDKSDWGVVSIEGAAAATIADCVIEGSAAIGLNLPGGGNADVRRCTFSGTLVAGLNLWSFSRATVRESAFTACGASGIRLLTGQLDVRDCRLSRAGATAILLEGGRATIEGCPRRTPCSVSCTRSAVWKESSASC